MPHMEISFLHVQIVHVFLGFLLYLQSIHMPHMDIFFYMFRLFIYSKATVSRYHRFTDQTALNPFCCVVQMFNMQHKICLYVFLGYPFESQCSNMPHKDIFSLHVQIVYVFLGFLF